MLAAITAFIASIPAAPAVWIDAPFALDAGLEATEIERISGALQKAVSSAVAGEVVYGAAPVLATGRQAPANAVDLARARALLADGKERYLEFRFAPAAASLAEAAALLTSALARLDSVDVERLYESRLLEGAAWVAAGQDQAAKSAFRKLLTIRPDFEPDPVVVSPEAREVFDRSLAELRAQGLAGIQVRTDPEGADVYLDGVKRGVTPLALAGLPPGNHGLRLVREGYETVARAISLLPKQQMVNDTPMRPTAVMASYQRIRAAAKSGESLTVVQADLSLVAREIGCASIILVGVAERPGGRVVTFRRWSPEAQSAVVVLVDDTSMQRVVAGMTPMLLRNTWPAVQLPEESVPIVVDFSRALLGVGPDWGGEPVASPSLVRRWWFWTGLAVLVAGAVTVGVVAASSGGEPAARDRVELTLEFPP